MKEPVCQECGVGPGRRGPLYRHRGAWWHLGRKQCDPTWSSDEDYDVEAPPPPSMR